MTELPWKTKLKPRHQRQEQDIERRGGTTHPASGRIWRFKRDGKLYDFLIEARTTEQDSYSISLKEWETITKEAHMTPPGCMPALQLDLKDTRLITIEFVVFEEMYNQLVAMAGALGVDGY